MERKAKGTLKSFAVELLIYAGLMAGYYFLVLHLLGDWLNRLFEQDRRFYAAISLILIIGQGVLLEVMTRFLLASIKPRVEAE